VGAGTPEVVPRPAATVAILRDPTLGRGVEVWLMRRQPTMAFAPGAHVFPGGAVDPPDHDPGIPLAPDDLAHVVDAFGVDLLTARGLVNAAVRETFEECGVLLAESGDVAPALDAWEARRLALLEAALSWPELVTTTGAVPAARALVPWSRWITPDWSPRRFDAYFFVTALPRGQDPRWVGGEADRAGWFAVRDAVAAHDTGDLPMLPPTIATLRALAEHDTVRSALAAGRRSITVESG
jgi:8-oxo-dGTP pyrophosphatase MutT (NUDIX family)